MQFAVVVGGNLVLFVEDLIIRSYDINIQRMCGFRHLFSIYAQLTGAKENFTEISAHAVTVLQP